MTRGIARSFLVALVAAAALVAGSMLVSPASATAPIGGEQDLGKLVSARIAMDAHGDFVVVGLSFVDGAGSVVAQRYDSYAHPVGDRIVVGTHDGDETVRSDTMSVAMNASGQFVVGWALSLFDSSAEIHARTYDSFGIPTSADLRVDPVSPCCSDYVSGTTVGIDADGGFVVGWSRRHNIVQSFVSDVLVQRFDASATAIGVPTAVNAPTDQGIRNEAPVISMNPAGAFVVLFGRYTPTANPSHFDATLYVRTLRPDGTPRGSEVRVDDSGAAIAYDDVSMTPTGSFVVAWSETIGATSADGTHQRGRRFAASGKPVGQSFVVETTPGTLSDRVSVATDALGRFLILWTTLTGQLGTPGGVDILGRQYAADGQPLGGQFLVSQLDDADDQLPDVATDADGDAVAIFAHASSVGGGERLRRLSGPEPIDLTPVATVSPNPVAPGGLLTYSVTVQNPHPVSTATGVAVIDAAIGEARGVHLTIALPMGASGPTAAAPGWACSYPTGRVVCDYSPLLPANSSSAPLQITVTAPIAAVGARLSSKIVVSADEPDPVPANNGRTVRTTIG